MEIRAPTIVILFEHDDVTGPSSAADGTVEVTHYYGACRTEIGTGPFSSALGELILDPSTYLDEDFWTRRPRLHHGAEKCTTHNHSYDYTNKMEIVSVDNCELWIDTN